VDLPNFWLRDSLIARRRLSEMGKEIKKDCSQKERFVPQHRAQTMQKVQFEVLEKVSEPKIKWRKEKSNFVHYIEKRDAKEAPPRRQS